MKRVLVLGLPGSGKTTLARKIAERHGLRHIELDSIFWGKNWEKPSQRELEDRVDNFLIGSETKWTLDNYSSRLKKAGMLDKADTVILLDLPVHLCMRRVFRRSTGRIFSRKRLWGNADGPAETPLSAIKLLLVIPKWKKGVTKIFEDLKSQNSSGVVFYRFDSNKQANEELLK